MIKDEFHLLPLFFFFFAHLMPSWPHFGYSPTSSIVLLRSSSRQPPPGAAPPCTSVTSSGGCTESLGFCQQTADVPLGSPPLLCWGMGWHAALPLHPGICTSHVPGSPRARTSFTLTRGLQTFYTKKRTSFVGARPALFLHC